MNLLAEILEQFANYMHSGGFVMWPLFIATFVLWYGLGYRYHALNRGSVKSVRNLVRKYRDGSRQGTKGLVDGAVVEGIALVDTYGCSRETRRMMDDAFFKYLQESKRFSRLVLTIVIAAPLTGLLGTVVGMIETFDSLATMELFTQGGGIAGGISQALFTTQLGLVVAVPGMVIGRMLDKKADIIEMDLEQIKDILCSEGA
jgi:biopolymer transport protein ExbB